MDSREEDPRWRNSKNKGPAVGVWHGQGTERRLWRPELADASKSSDEKSGDVAGARAECFSSCYWKTQNGSK